MPLRDDGHGLAQLALAAFALAALLLFVPAPVAAQEEIPTDPNFDARGFSARRESGSLLPFEHIDPFTGNLLLTFTDLRLPGNAGFDLVIQRTYNSKIYADYGRFYLPEDSWAGLGWSLHMGRVILPGGTSIRAIVEMPDGSSHPVYQVGTSSTDTITRSLWRYDSSQDPPVLKLTNGVVYRFGHRGNKMWDGRDILYATEITDPFGNRIEISYWVTSVSTAPRDAIRTIKQYIGNQTRTVDFSYDSSSRKALDEMSYFDGSRTRKWIYDQSALDNHSSFPESQLDSVQPPQGPAWRFTYNATHQPYYELTRVTTPNGGIVDYTYDWFTYRYCRVAVQPPTGPILTRGVVQRKTSGRDVDPGTWSYAYAQGSKANQTVVSSPCNRTVYTFYGIGGDSGQWCPEIPMLAYKLGAQLGKEVFQGGDLLERETLNWSESAFIAHGPETVGHYTIANITNPLLSTRTVERYPGGSVNVTRHEYNPGNYNDFGRPFKTEEEGQLKRTTTRSFDYAFGARYIKDRVGSETVAVENAPLSYTGSAEYRDSDGFKESETVYGIKHTFGPAAGGNVAWVKNALNHQTSFTYDWGVLDQTQTPRYTIDRTINPDGTVQREVRRGFTTSFGYDNLFRRTSVQPPLGHASSTGFDDAHGTFMTTTRGLSWTRTDLDGFGRPSGTANSQGVFTDVGRDACGRVDYQSYPHSAGGNTGTTLTLDGLGRVRQADHPDGSWTKRSYNGVDVTVEELVEDNQPKRFTFQDWSTFGDPDEGLLSGLKDGNGHSWSYAYTALGRLRLVTPPVGGARSWTYNGKDQLQSEFHPESGTTSYTYDDAGRPWTRTDARSQMTTFTHDANGRLERADGPGTTYRSYTWDASDNRTLADNGRVRSDFSFDGNNRLESRTDTFAGQAFTTGYGYDDNDNPKLVEYPSGLSIDYEVNTQGQVTKVRRAGTTTNYASSFLYHPSGAVRSFNLGNQPQSFGYDARHRIETLRTGVLDLKYDHNYVGNVKTITDNLRPSMSQSFGYDGADRLTFASGWWGSGTIAYWADGNRHTSTVGGSSGYDYLSGRLTTVTGTGADSFEYDNNGNMRSSAGGANTYTHSPENFMESATVGGVTTAYRYDADGLRKLKAIGGGATRYYVHGSGGQLLAEYETMCAGGARLVKNYIYAGSRLVAAISPAVPTVTLESGASTVAETGGSAPVRVKLTTPSGGQTEWVVCVAYSTANGTATAGSDYGAVQGILTLPIGFASGNTIPINVPIHNDPDMNDTEQFYLSLTSAQGATLTGTATHTVTIQDDDAPAIAFVLPSTTAPEASGTSPVQVKVTTRDGQPLIAQATVAYATTNGSAVGGADFVPATGTLTFPVGFASGGTLPIATTVLVDALNEDPETFQLVLASPVNAVIGTPAAHSITIADDDPLPSLVVAHATAPEPPGGGVDVLLTVALTAPSGRQVSVGYATADVNATAGADYVSNAGTVTFPPGAVTQTIAVRLLPDDLDEANEAFLVRLTAPVNALVADDEAQGVILDDDGGPQHCSPVASVPFTIAANGQYCLVRHLALATPSGAAISIEANDVVLDLEGFTLSGRAAGTGTLAVGVHAVNRARLTVRNGAVEGFLVGVGLAETSPDTSARGGHLVERVRALENTFIGLDVRGRGNVVRNNQVFRTGGTTGLGSDSDAYGVFTLGGSPRILGNDVSGTRPTGTSRAHGIAVADGYGAVIEANRVDGPPGASAVGIWLLRASHAMAIGNAISGTTQGLVFDQSSGKYRDNVCAGVTTPYSGGSDAGNNY